MQQTVSFPSGDVKFLFQKNLEALIDKQDLSQVIFITNEHISRLYSGFFGNYKTIVIPAGEHTKDLQTISSLAKDLLQLDATRKSILVGVGGGVITDITGFLASVYMRGVRFGFVPTTILGMVDAAIGGKNGVDIGLNKNILGTFCHPEFILYDINFLKTLPGHEWSNGFAEIIKYAFCFDKSMYDKLAKNYISFYKEDENELIELIEKCVALKIQVVCNDEKEKGKRKLLNFGHTIGHAIENLCELPHGFAVGIGMVIACKISTKITGLNPDVTEKLTRLLQQYYLPIHQKINPQKVMDILKMDKKRNGNKIDFVLLEQLGTATIYPLSLDIIDETLKEYAGNN